MSKKKGKSLPAKAFRKLAEAEEDDDDDVDDEIGQVFQQSNKKSQPPPKLMLEQKTESNMPTKQKVVKRQNFVRKMNTQTKQEELNEIEEDDPDELPLVEWNIVSDNFLNFEAIKNVILIILR